MRRTVLILSLTAAAIFLHVSTAFANGFVSYVITSSYADPNTQSSAVSSPNQTFQLSFTLGVPVATINSDPSSFTTTTPVIFHSGSTTLTDAGSVQIFFAQGSGGGLNLQFTLPGRTLVTWSFTSQQLYGGSTTNPTLFLGLFPTVPVISNFTYGSTSSTTLGPGTILASTPEPGSLLLVGSGLLGLAASLRKRLWQG